MKQKLILESLSDHKHIPSPTHKVPINRKIPAPGCFVGHYIVHPWDCCVYSDLYTVRLYTNRLEHGNS